MIYNDGHVAFIESKGTGVTFSASSIVTEQSSPVVPTIKNITNKLDVFYWGEDNRFPQNVVNHLAACGVAQSFLKWKTTALWGSGLVYGKVVDIDAQGNEVFKVAMPDDFPDVDKFWEENEIEDYFAQYGIDYYYFANCWPELIASKDRKKIVAITLPKSPDCRWKQMGENGLLDTVYISKLWGANKDQFALFDPKKNISGLYNGINPITEADGKYIIQKRALNQKFPYDDLVDFMANSKDSSCLLPVNFPSPNKTYYHLPSWDGARVSGWIEIASKVPSLLKSLYNKAFNIRYHIEIPTDYFAKQFGKKVWDDYDLDTKKKHQDDLLKKIDSLLTGSDNAYKSLITFFGVNEVNGADMARVKITKVDSKNDTSADLLTSGTANHEIAAAMNVNPNIMGLGTPGGVYSSNQGGSNIREGKLEHDAGLHLDRQIALRPFKLIKRFNKWPSELEFRFKDTVLLTLDKGKQTETSIK